ncbi:beta strand repeat-containing protein [Cryobacterium suzukii]|nr:Ig-like domain-containing protein [Cryobacterium suzukii]
MIALRWTGAVGVLALIGSLLAGGVAAATTVTVRPNFGFANSYVVLGNSAVTIGPSAVVTGTFGSDLGMSSETGVYTNGGTLAGVGAVNLGNAAARRAQADLTAAHTAALALTGDFILPGEINAMTLRPGIHTADSNVTLTGTVTLDAGGDADAIFIMVPHGAFDTSANARVRLINGAQAGNAYWFIGAAFTIAADADFSGRVIGGTAGTLSANSTLHGQLLTTGTAITLSAGARIINDAPSGTATTDWVDQNLGAMTDGVSYSDRLSVASSDNRSVGAEDVAWAVTAGQLPPGINLGPVTGTVAGTRTDSASYSWSITATIVGNIRITKSFSTEDVSAPAVMISGGATRLTNDRTPTISGTTDAPEGSVVSVLIDGITVTSVVAQGAFSVPVADLGADATYPTVVTITVTGAAGTARQTITLDTTAPSLVIAGGSSLTTADSTPTILGTTDAPVGTAVAVTVAGQTLATTVADGGGWSATAGALAEGEHTITVSITDLVGNSGSATQALTHNAKAPTVIFAGGATLTTTDRTPTISGTTNAADGSVVTVLIDSAAVSSTVTAGAWSVLAADLGTDGAHPAVVTITASGVAGMGSQTITLDTTRPSLAIDAGSTLINDATPTISGTTDAADGTVVTVTVSNQTLLATVTAGTWSISIGALSDGNHRVFATVTDPVGNSETVTQTYTLDTLAPVVSISGGSALTSADTTPTVSGTSDALVGTAVSVVVGTQTLGATVIEGGRWSVTAAALAEGDHSVTASITDATGNTGVATQVYSVIAAPDVTVTGGAAAASNNPAPTFVGTSTAAAGSAVTVTIGGQILRTTVTAAGTWSVASADISVDGDYTVAVTVVDLVTKISADSAQIFTIDTTAPAVAVTVAPTGRTRDTTPKLSGTTDAPVGAILSVTVAGQELSVTVQLGGVWTVEPGPLADGNVDVVVTAEDRYGNARSVSQSFVVATTPPTNTTLEQTVTEGALQSLAVTGADFDPGESVQVWIHSTPVLLSTVTANANGAIVTSVIVPAATAAGRHHIVMIGVTSSTAQLASETIFVINSGTGTGTGTGSVRIAESSPETTELARTGLDATVVGGAALLLFLAGVLVLILRLRTRNIPRHISQ